jgi:hypothetical protein
MHAIAKKWVKPHKKGDHCSENPIGLEPSPHYFMSTEHDTVLQRYLRTL